MRRGRHQCNVGDAPANDEEHTGVKAMGASHALKLRGPLRGCARAAQGGCGYGRLLSATATSAVPPCRQFLDSEAAFPSVSCTFFFIGVEELGMPAPAVLTSMLALIGGARSRDVRRGCLLHTAMFVLLMAPSSACCRKWSSRRALAYHSCFGLRACSET